MHPTIKHPSTLHRKNSLTLDTTPSLSRLQKRRIVLERLYDSQQKIIGKHRKLQSTQITNMQEAGIGFLKFKRTSSPEKPFKHSSNSPVKAPQYMSSEGCLNLLSLNFGRCDTDTLCLENRDKGFRVLKKMGFVNNEGVANVKFIERFEQVLGVKYQVKKSASSNLLNKPKMRMGKL